LSVETIILNAFFIALMCMPPILNYLGKPQAATYTFTTTGLLIVILLSLAYGRPANFQIFLFPWLVLSFVIFPNAAVKEKLRLILVFVIVYALIEWRHSVYPSGMLLHLDSYTEFIIRQMTHSISFMVISVQCYIFSLKNNKLIKTSLEQTQYLEEKNAELEHFAYIASHDLNEPLRTVKSFVEILEEDTQANDQTRQYFLFIREAQGRLQKMITGILEHSRLGKSREFLSTDLQELVEDLKAEFSSRSSAAEFTIKAGQLPTIKCLPLEVKTLFRNLMDNALRFKSANREPFVEISCTSQVDRWKFSVSDNGIGIRAEKHQDVFKFFYQLHRKDKYPGNGMGLPQCKKIVELHQGEIWVESIPGQGSTFHFTISNSLE